MIDKDRWHRKYRKIRQSLFKLSFHNRPIFVCDNIWFMLIKLYDFCIKMMFGSFVWYLMPYLRYLCLFTHSGVQHILCCVFVLFVFVLCTLCCQFLWIVRFLITLFQNKNRFIYFFVHIVNRLIYFQHCTWQFISPFHVTRSLECAPFNWNKYNNDI
jgi:hypothetical protein